MLHKLNANIQTEVTGKPLKESGLPFHVYIEEPYSLRNSMRSAKQIQEQPTVV